MSQIDDGYREPVSPELITKRQTAVYLQVGPPTNDNHLCRGLLHVYKFAGWRLVRSRCADVLALLGEVPR